MVRFSRWRIPAGAVIVASVALAPFNVAGTAVALPAVASQLGADTTALQWAVNAFNVAFAACMLVVGPLADRFGARRTFAVGLVIVLVASAMSSLAPDLWFLDAGRAVAGVGCAAVMAGGLALISTSYPPGPRRSRMFAMFGVAVGIGLALGPTAMGALTEVIGWRGLYALFGGVAALALVLTPRLPSGARPASRTEGRADLSVLRRPRFVAFALVPLVPAVGFVPIYTYLPVALSAVFDMSAAEAGAFMLPMALPVLLGPVLAARAIHRLAWFTPTTVVYISCAALLLGDLGMLVLDPARSVGLIVVPLMLVSLGYGLQMGLVDAEAMAAVPERSSGTAAGMVNFCRTGSAALVVTAYGALLAGQIGRSLPEATAAQVAAGDSAHPATYADAFGFAALLAACIVAVLSIAVALLQVRARRTEAGAAPAPGVAGCSA